MKKIHFPHRPDYPAPTQLLQCPHYERLYLPDEQGYDKRLVEWRHRYWLLTRHPLTDYYQVIPVTVEEAMRLRIRYR